ncbi:MAG: immunoglobulin domain-containing protein [Verrucomicrobia bacterium]|nr:immunoglobulin domain-containing protein [Verrucomicrobiota bacterium]
MTLFTMLGLVWLCPGNLRAQEGSLDATFNPSLGRGFSQPVVRAISEQGDGKLLIGGEFVSVNGATRNRIARLNSDGSLESAFASASGADGDVQGIAVQGDGRVLIGGNFTSVNGTPRNRIARLNSDGSLDSSFVTAVGADGAVRPIVVQGDGRVLIGGFFASVNGASRNRIARLKNDGSVDGSFNVGTGASGSVTCMALQTDGKVVICGSFTSFNGTARNRIARLNSDGSLDTGFNPGSGADDWISAMALQTDGKVVVGGDFKTFNSTSRTRLARLNSNGSLDTSFSPTLAAIPGYGMDIDAIAAQDDGKLVIGGSFGSINGTPRTRVARLNRDGTLDPSFNPGSGANDWVFSIAVQRDGRIVIGGWFTSVGGTPRTQIARLLGSAPAAVAPSITIQPQSRTVAAGASVSFSITATGTAPLRYQWRKDGIDIPGASESSLFLFSATASGAGVYTVVVSNAAGSVTSSAATLAITVPASISSQPQSQTVTIGANPTFTVVAAGTEPLAYQWKKEGATLVDGGRISGATTDTLTITGVQIADAGVYTVVITNPAGSTTSSNAVLTINLNPSVSFADAKLEAAIRSALAQPAGVITVSNMSALVELSLQSESITNLSGLQWASQLAYLNAERNQIANVSPLAGLTNLTSLLLNENALSDIVPLSGLTKLNTLALKQAHYGSSKWPLTYF